MIPRIVSIVACILLAASAHSSLAADIQPGLWELTVNSKIAVSPEFSSEPLTMQQCLTELDAQDPSRVLGGVANPGATGCTYTEKSFDGNIFRFKMECTGLLGIQTRGEIAYTAMSMDGSIISMVNVAGQDAMLRSRIVAHRIGGC